MQAAASMDFSALSLGTTMALPSGALPVETRDVAAGGDDAVEGGAVDDQVLDDRESFGAPGLEVEHVAVLEMAHVQLADGGAGCGPWAIR